MNGSRERPKKEKSSGESKKKDDKQKEDGVDHAFRSYP